jgi:hypothetical protein
MDESGQGSFKFQIWTIFGEDSNAGIKVNNIYFIVISFTDSISSDKFYWFIHDCHVVH